MGEPEENRIFIRSGCVPARELEDGQPLAKRQTAKNTRKLRKVPRQEKKTKTNNNWCIPKT